MVYSRARIALFWLALPHFQRSIVLPDVTASWFFPYGIFLFAFSGMSIIPDIVDLFGRKNEARFRKVIIAGTFIVAAIYALFIVAVVGFADGFVSEDAVSSLDGRLIISLGALLGFLAILTSYFALGLELRLTFQYDLGISRLIAWEFIVALPLILFLLSAQFSSLRKLPDIFYRYESKTKRACFARRRNTKRRKVASS